MDIQQKAFFCRKKHPSVRGVKLLEADVSPAITRYSAYPDVLAWKLTGAGGGGYLVLVVADSHQFAQTHREAIELHIRRG